MPISSRFVVRSTIGLLAVGFLTLLGIIGATIWLGERAQVYFNDVIATRDTRIAAVELRNALVTAESSQRGFVVTGNEIYLAPYDSAKVQALRQFTLLQRALASDRDAGPLLQRLNVVIGDKIKEMDETIGLKTNLRDGEALTILRTNRGKALMDEASLFLSGIIGRVDERLTAGVSEQRANAAWLRWVSIIGGFVIMLVVGGVIVTILQYAREIAATRDEVRALNSSLEERVKLRTAELARARDRAEVLLTEVNHRVANSLSLIASLVTLQARSLTDPSVKDALNKVTARIYAISSVHKKLYSSGDVRFVALNEYLSGLLDHLSTSNEGSGATLRYDLEPLKLPTDASINLGVAVTELITNAFKYAYPGSGGEIRVRLRSLPDHRAELVVEDDGVGRSGEAPSKGTGLGTRIVNAMAATVGAEVKYLPRDPGTSAQLIFPLQSS